MHSTFRNNLNKLLHTTLQCKPALQCEPPPPHSKVECSWLCFFLTLFTLLFQIQEWGGGRGEGTRIKINNIQQFLCDFVSFFHSERGEVFSLCDDSFSRKIYGFSQPFLPEEQVKGHFLKIKPKFPALSQLKISANGLLFSFLKRYPKTHMLFHSQKIYVRIN
jgi:hypothetical protein